MRSSVCHGSRRVRRPTPLGLSRGEEDFYVSLPYELGLIGAAGFPRPECFWRDGMLAVYGAFKDG